MLPETPSCPAAGFCWSTMKILKFWNNSMDSQIFSEVEHLPVLYLISPLFVGCLPNSPIYLATQVPRNENLSVSNID